ncbi:MAG: DNA adenine methylase [Methanoregulaceae archaeon]|nr:DNA adenine methylase [Methanoregulaceae archaeon]
MIKQKFKGIPSEIEWEKFETLSGKGSTVYNAHPYHTKLSFNICQTIISKLSEKDEIVLDPFCGSGIVGVAAILEGRDAVVNDLSPYAIHVARGLTTKAPLIAIKKNAKRIIEKVKKEVSPLVLTNIRNSDQDIEFSYLIWSDYVYCSSCNSKFLLWDVAIRSDGSIKKEFNCPHCWELIQKKALKRSSGIPVEIVYWNGGKAQHREKPNKDDLKKALEAHIDKQMPWFPNESMLNAKPGTRWGEQWRKGYHEEITHVRDFFSKRNWIILAFLWDEIKKVKDDNIRNLLKLCFTGTLVNVSKMVRYIPSRGGRSNTPGTLYCPSVWLEQNPLLVFERRIEKICKLVEKTGKTKNKTVAITGSASNLNIIADNSIDLIVTDPPFGANIQYAELNFLPEAWLQEFTDIRNEAVENPFREQGRQHYIGLIEGSLHEMYRVLKPGRYAAFFFNTTDTTLWRDLKGSFKKSGFKIIKSIPALKGHAGWNQVRHQETVAGWDPVIFLWKPYGQTTLLHHSESKNQICSRKFISEEVKKSNGDETYPYQLWYSRYVSEWFKDGIEDELLNITEFVKIAKEEKGLK